MDLSPLCLFSANALRRPLIAEEGWVSSIHDSVAFLPPFPSQKQNGLEPYHPLKDAVKAESGKNTPDAPTQQFRSREAEERRNT